jgi:hypothetical protein
LENSSKELYKNLQGYLKRLNGQYHENFILKSCCDYERICSKLSPDVTQKYKVQAFHEAARMKMVK